MNKEADTTHSAFAQKDLALYDLLSGTFNSVMDIEERSLSNRITKGLTISEIHTIAAIGMYEVNPMNVIAARLGITLATLTTSVKRLADRGLVARQKSEKDKRQVLISLTSDGRKVYRAHRLFHEKMLAAALEGLSKEEERVLASALSHVKAYFDEQNELALASSTGEDRR